VALFDLLVNNADRKGSHIIVDKDNRLWLIDHGICFHAEPKLRTVVWDFAGEPLPEELCADVRALAAALDRLEGEQSSLVSALDPYLSRAEIGALAAQAQRLLAAGRFPNPPRSRRPFPWPPL
jgi:uncharacterized repeat protein (TIGR03843 family)